MIQVLFLAANPSEKAQLNLNGEFESIRRKLKESVGRDKFDLETVHAVSAKDLTRVLIYDYHPHIVHFSGHGSEQGALLLENREGQAEEVRQDALAELFDIITKRNKDLHCVVLNACYSEKQAKAISQHVDCVIGMRGEVKDNLAQDFSVEFYQALGNGDNIEEAFKISCIALGLTSIDDNERPKLITRQGIDPSKIRFTGREQEPRKSAPAKKKSPPAGEKKARPPPAHVEPEAESGGYEALEDATSEEGDELDSLMPGLSKVDDLKNVLGKDTHSAASSNFGMNTLPFQPYGNWMINVKDSLEMPSDTINLSLSNMGFVLRGTTSVNGVGIPVEGSGNWRYDARSQTLYLEGVMAAMAIGTMPLVLAIVIQGQANGSYIGRTSDGHTWYFNRA